MILIPAPAARLIVAIAAAALSLSVAACSSDDAGEADDPEVTATVDSNPDGTAPDGDDEPATSDPEVATIPETTLSPAVVDVTDEPGQSGDDFVDARSDTTLDRCESVDGKFTAEGEVTNSSGVDAAYRIYVSFNLTDSPLSRGLVQVDLDVADGATEKWEATAELEEEDLDCILRVERVGAAS